ncbi:MAG TPA: hypothetical protein VMT19_09210 [Thermoanaerobaculaceae bacterium]|nr:hypothetical protein [Thermoanaerobaculaceae bacterium]
MSAALIAAVLALCACQASPGPVPLPSAAPGWIPALPATNEALSRVLVAAARGGMQSAWTPDGDERFRGYLATLAWRGPSSHPELYPSTDDLLAFLVDAHIAWALALGHAATLAGRDVASLREQPFVVDGRTSSLRLLSEEIAWRAASEPRLALVLNAGWRGGPPLPAVAIEGRSLAWQLAMQADRCGRLAGFWQVDTASKRLSVSAFTELMWGLPASQPARARRLLDLVPPPAELRVRIVAACGASLQRCAIALSPVDTGRMFTPERPHR